MKPENLDAVVILGLFALLSAILGVLAFIAIPDKNVQLFTALASGVVGAGVATIINNRWGTSRSSERKDDTIAKLSRPADADPKG